LLWDFINFWKWKLEIENGCKHILDDNFREETFRRLSSILPGWKTYRPFSSSQCLKILKNSLETISDAYNIIKDYSLLEFNEIPDEPLRLIWHELGRTKEEHGSKNDGGLYYIIAVCKPLMLLWGQTLAYDSLVRENIPYRVPADIRWSFEDWKRVTVNFQRDLKQNSEIINLFKEKSRETYRTDSIVPYGEFLDYYYWYQGKCR